MIWRSHNKMDVLCICRKSWIICGVPSSNTRANSSPDLSGKACLSCSSSSSSKMALLEQAETAPPENCRRLVILGSSKVGKTSIASRFLYNKFDEKYTPTIEDFHRKIYRIKGAPYRLDILDTSGNHPFPAMRRLSLLTGDLFILVYSIDNRGSYQEVCHLREQILECKKQCAKDSTKQRRTKLTPMVIVGSKCDKEKEREVHEKEVRRLVEGQPNCDFIESSAKKNINIDEIFVKLFDVADLPLEMSPSLHRKVPHTYVGSNSPTQKRGMSIRRKLSDACGTIAPNVRRPSIRTDLLVAQLSGNRQVTERDEPREQKCLVQ